MATPPEKDEFLLYRNYLTHQLDKQGVTFAHADIQSAADLVSYQADSVIVATGARQSVPPINGAELEHVLLAEDVLAGQAVGERVAIIGGGLVGTETAKYLAVAGKQVTIIEMLDTIGNGIGVTFAGRLFDYLAQKDVQQITGANIVEIQADKIVLADREVPVDTVVIAAGYTPNNELVNELKKVYSDVHTVGDVNEPRRIIDATAEGFLAGASV